MVIVLAMLNYTYFEGDEFRLYTDSIEDSLGNIVIH